MGEFAAQHGQATQGDQVRAERAYMGDHAVPQNLKMDGSQRWIAADLIMSGCVRSGGGLARAANGVRDAGGEHELSKSLIRARP